MFQIIVPLLLIGALVLLGQDKAKKQTKGKADVQSKHGKPRDRRLPDDHANQRHPGAEPDHGEGGLDAGLEPSKVDDDHARGRGDSGSGEHDAAPGGRQAKPLAKKGGDNVVQLGNENGGDDNAGDVRVEPTGSERAGTEADR